MGKWKFEVCSVCGRQDDTVENKICPACKAIPKAKKEEIKEEAKKPAAKTKPLTSGSFRGKK